MFVNLSDLKQDFLNIFISLNYSGKKDGYFDGSFMFDCLLELEMTSRLSLLLGEMHREVSQISCLLSANRQQSKENE